MRIKYFSLLRYYISLLALSGSSTIPTFPQLSVEEDSSVSELPGSNLTWGDSESVVGESIVKTGTNWSRLPGSRSMIGITPCGDGTLEGC